MTTRPNLGKINVPLANNANKSPRLHAQKGLGRSTQITLPSGELIKLNFDDLELGDSLGEGRFGSVRKCYHPQSNMTFAVKRLNNSSETDSDNQRLRDIEIPLLLKNNSEFTIKFYGALFAETHFWIINECMKCSLEQFSKKALDIDKNYITELFLSKVAFSILSAIACLKSNNVLHRDIKPSNILLDDNGKIKLCDFGISGIMKNSLAFTFDRGCRPYMAPERISPENSESGYNVKSDIWSLAISLIEVATGIHPYNQVGPASLEIAICKSPPPKLPNNKYSIEFQEFINLSLITNPQERADLHKLLDLNFIKNNLSSEITLEYFKIVYEKL